MKIRFLAVLQGVVAFISATLAVLAEDLPPRVFIEGSDDACLKFMESHPELIEHKCDLECTPLHYAAVNGKLKTAKWLLAHKADVNTTAYNKFTPMHVVRDGATANLLIKAGANLHAIDAWGKTPLQEAAFMSSWPNLKGYGYKDVCEAILASGYPIDLLSALWLRKRVVAIKMIKETPSIATKIDVGTDLWGNTSPLGLAASNGDKEIVELLLKAGAEVNNQTFKPNGSAISPLCNAVWMDHYEVAKILCEAGADCNAWRENDGVTLLDCALRNGDTKMITLLIEHGAKWAEDKVNASERAFLEREPCKLNGHKIRLAISFPEDIGAPTQAWLCLNIDTARDAALMHYCDFKVSVKDLNGERIVAKPLERQITKEGDHQCARFYLILNIDQKIKAVRIRWGGADRTFLYSKGEISDVFHQ